MERTTNELEQVRKVETIEELQKLPFFAAKLNPPDLDSWEAEPSVPNHLLTKDHPLFVELMGLTDVCKFCDYLAHFYLKGAYDAVEPLGFTHMDAETATLIAQRSLQLDYSNAAAPQEGRPDKQEPTFFPNKKGATIPVVGGQSCFMHVADPRRGYYNDGLIRDPLAPAVWYGAEGWPKTGPTEEKGMILEPARKSSADELIARAKELIGNIPGLEEILRKELDKKE